MNRLWTIGCAMTFWALLGMSFLLTGCGGGVSSSGAGGAYKRVPITDLDRQAIETVGGYNGPWLIGTRELVRVDREPPGGTNWAQAECPYIVFYNSVTPEAMPLSSRADLLVHEGQHIKDGCKTGRRWEDRAADAVRCWKEGTPRAQCVIRNAG